MKKRAALLILAFTVALPSLVAAQKPLVVPMKWTPTDPPPTVPPIDLTGGGVYPVRIDPVIDRRERGPAVGEHPGDKRRGTVSVVTDSDVPAFLTSQVRALLERFGVQQTTDASAARVLRLELLDLWVVDADSYRGTARMKVAITDADNQEVWTAIITGTGDNGGRSLKPINYQETFSNAIQSFVGNLLKAEAFQKALKKTARS